jgi:hypothetical protein
MAPPIVALLPLAFPSYDDPTSVGPSVLSSAPACEVPLFNRVGLQSYGQLETRQFAPPPKCPPPWDSVVLQFVGEVRGVQFDRYGAMWLSGVELLRTTTPEV